MQFAMLAELSKIDKVSASITVTVKIENSVGSAIIDLAEYEFMKENSDIDLIYDTVERLTLELQRGI
jgi:hypothetical protein